MAGKKVSLNAVHGWSASMKGNPVSIFNYSKSKAVKRICTDHSL